jgi:hypothetical protein
MHDAAGDGVLQAPHDQNATYRAVVSDLVSLIEHVQKILRLIEQTIARETSLEMTPGSRESSTDIIVLDDISPRYVKADAALQACDFNPGIALRSLLDSSDSDPCAASLRASGHRGVRPTRRRPAGAYDVPPPQIFSRIFSRGQPPAAIAVWRPACHRRAAEPGCHHDDGETGRGAQ